ncbi:RecF/RecN/SMC N terminal domain-containing protein [Spironucleus salmonicida]|uniref:Structural maintenance of chromosomes protein 5 n=1 Tax=Spironucleus salmonicida TaxID=348837 RepID=V6M2F4_9EUKA|nr:RecF/RecN/SMC N terminal domain-containing protein [Spironucleus salmonicida]|eukprot:EST47424.1 RecF/RecN/SMC N terminal domain-containing protein [Spironucleus salmonicida]
MFQNGNIKKILLYNFKGVRHLEVNLSPSVNFLLAPNGHGKSSILQGIALCLGSQSTDLNGLLFEDQDKGYAQIEIFNSPNSHTIKVQVLSDNSRIYFIDGAKATVQSIKKLVSQLNIVIDNPFVSMMQHSAQRIMEVNAFERLQYITSLCNKSEAFNVDVSDILIRLDEFSTIYQKFIGQRNLYIKSAKDFQIFEELEHGKRIIFQLEKYVALQKLYDTIFQKNQADTQLIESIKQKQLILDCVAQLNRDVDLLNKELLKLDSEKSKQFHDFKRKYEQQSQQKIVLRQYLIDLKSLKKEQQKISQLQNQSNFDQKQSLETQLNVIKNQKFDLLSQMDEMSQKLIKLRTNDNTDNSLLNNISESFLNIKKQRASLQYQLKQYASSCKNSQWFDYCSQVQQQLTGQFMIFPVLSHIAVNQLSIIPQTDARLIIQIILGNDINTVITSSFDINTNLSQKFADFQSKGGATNVSTLPSQYFGLSYKQAFELAKKEQIVNEQSVKLKALKQHQMICCLDILIGNYIVINQFASKFKSVYYIKHEEAQSEQFLQKEIDYIFENNNHVSAIYAKNKLYKVLKYNNQYNGKQVQQIQPKQYSQTSSYLQISTEQSYLHEIIIQEQFNDIQQQYDSKQSQLNNAKELFQAKELQIKKMKNNVDMIKSQVQQIDTEIENKQREIGSIRTVTQEEIHHCNSQIQKIQEKNSVCLLKICQIAKESMIMQVDCSDIMIQWSNIENKIEQLKITIEDKQLSCKSIKNQIIDQENKIQLLCVSYEQQIENLSKFKIKIKKESDFLPIFNQEKHDLQEETIKIIEESNNIQQTLQQLQQKLKLKISQQNVDLTQLQEDILKSYHMLLNLYNYISKEALNLFNSFEASIQQLQIFLGSLNKQFMINLQSFSVSGSLKLKTWKSGPELANNKELQEQKKLLENNQFQILNQSMNPQEISEILQQFSFDAQSLSAILRRFSPGVDVDTKFSSSEKLSAASLSGGERSVISLCLACCLQGIPIRVIDEINQGMDEEFEKCAHEMVRSLQGQVIVSSPKVNSQMNFDNVNIIILSRKPINDD